MKLSYCKTHRIFGTCILCTATPERQKVNFDHPMMLRQRQEKNAEIRRQRDEELAEQKIRLQKGLPRHPKGAIL